MNQLKCVNCNGFLQLEVGFDGCDEDSVAGKGSGFNHYISLVCNDCGRSFSVGRIRDISNFSENVARRRPYGGN